MSDRPPTPELPPPPDQPPPPLPPSSGHFGSGRPIETWKNGLPSKPPSPLRAPVSKPTLPSKPQSGIQTFSSNGNLTPMSQKRNRVEETRSIGAKENSHREGNYFNSTPKSKVRKVDNIDVHDEKEEEETRVLLGQMEDDSAVKQGKVPFRSVDTHPLSLPSSSPTKRLAATINPCVVDTVSKHATDSTIPTQGYSPPSPRITPINTQFPTQINLPSIDLSDILVFLAQSLEQKPQPSTIPYTLPDWLSEDDRQNLVNCRDIITCLRENILELQKEISSRDCTIEEFEVTVNRLELDLKSKTERNSQTEKLVKKIKMESEDLETEYKTQVKYWKDQCDRLFSQKSVLQEERDALLEEESVDQRELQKLEEKYLLSQNRIAELEGTVKSLGDDLYCTQTEKEVSEEESGKLKEEISKLQTEKETHTAATDHLKAELNTAIIETGKVNVLEENLEGLTKELERSQSSVKILQHSLQERQNQNCDLQTQIDTLSAEKSKLDKTLKDLRSAFTEWDLDSQPLKTQNDALVPEKNNLIPSATENSDRQHISSLEVMISRLTEEISRLKDDAEKARELQASTTESTESWMSTAQQHQRNVSKLTTQIADLEKLLAMRNPDMESSGTTLAQAIDRNRGVKTSDSALTANPDQTNVLEDLRKAIQETETRLAAKEIEKVACDIEIKSIKIEFNSMQETLTSKSKECLSLRNELDELRKGHSAVLLEKKVLEKRIISLENRPGIKSRVSTAESVIKTSTSTFSGIQLQSSSVSAQKTSPTLEKQNEDLRQRVANLQLALSAKEAELERCKDVRKNLDRRIDGLDKSIKEKDRLLDNSKNRTKEIGRLKVVIEGKEATIKLLTESLEGFKRELLNISSMRDAPQLPTVESHFKRTTRRDP